jgi:hypothetical protein
LRVVTFTVEDSVVSCSGLIIVTDLKLSIFSRHDFNENDVFQQWKLAEDMNTA